MERIFAGLHDSIQRPARLIRPLTPAARVSPAVVVPSLPCARLRTENITREAPSPPTMASPDGGLLASIVTDHSTPLIQDPLCRETPSTPSRSKMERSTPADRNPPRVLVSLSA